MHVKPEDIQNNDFFPPLAGSEMPSVIENLPPLPLEVRKTARVIADVVGMTQWAVGKSPKGVALSSIYLAELIHRADDIDRLTQGQLTEDGPVSELTVRKRYRDLPELFLEHSGFYEADDGNVYHHGERFDDPVHVHRVLREFADAEETGEGIPRVVNDRWRDIGGGS